MGRIDGKKPRGRPKRRLENNIKAGRHGIDWVGFRLGQLTGSCECGNESLGSIKCGELFD